MTDPMTEPSEAAKRAWADACDVVMGSACGDPDCEECKAAALVIERAMTERDRALREVVRELLPSKLCGESWNLPDSETVSITVTFGVLRKARAILASTGDAA